MNSYGWMDRFWLYGSNNQPPKTAGGKPRNKPSAKRAKKSRKGNR